MNEYQVDDEGFPVVYGLDEAKDTVTDSECYLGLGADGLGTGASTVVFCFSIQLEKAAAVSAAVAGLTNWQEKLKDAEADWAEYFAGLQGHIISLPVEHKAKVCNCLKELRTLSYSNGYLAAGLPNWDHDFIRDTSWVIYGLCALGHPQGVKLAENFANFFAGIDSFVHANSYTIDGVRTESSMNQTDSAPTFFMAIGKLFEATGYDATAIKGALDVALSYVETNYSVTDKHVLSLHAHDFWDDYVSEINTPWIKYESMIDVLWIAGLEAIAPVYTALGDTTRAAYCLATAASLRSSLEDFRNPTGGLYFAIKKDSGLYDTLEALPGTLYAAWLLDDEQCLNEVLYGSRHLLSLKGGPRYPMTHSNALTSSHKEEIWMPYVPIVAMLAMRKGDARLANDLAESFPFAGLPEYAKYQNTDELIWKSHAFSFPWAEAMYLIMIADML